MMDNGGGTGSSGVDRNADKKQQQQAAAAAAKDALMAWLMGEFTAANAIIDALCHHLRWICISSNMNSLFSFNQTTSFSALNSSSSSGGGGMGGYYEQVFAAIHRRRMNWIPVIKTQKYFPVAEVVAALRNVEQRTRSMPDLTDITTAAAVAAAAAVAVEKKRKKNHSNRKKRVMVDSININASSGSLSDEGKEPMSSSSLPEEDQVIVKHEIQIEPAPADDDYHEITDRQEEIMTITKEYQKLDQENTTAEEQAPKSRLGEDDDSSISGTETLSPSAVESSCLAQTKGDDWVISLHDGSNKCAKVAKDFETKKEINRHMVSIIEGVNLYENFLTDMELSKLVHFSDELRQSGQKGELPGETYIRFNEQKGNRREMIQLGVPIFRQRFNKPSNAEPIPDLLVPIIERLIQRDLMPESRKPNCCVINFFDEGEFSQPYVRPPHIDQPMSTISLITDCNVVFGDFSTKKCQVHSDGSLELTLQKGSLLVIHGNSVSTIHAIRPSPRKRTTITFLRVSSSKDDHLVPSVPLDLSQALILSPRISPPQWQCHPGPPPVHHFANGFLGNIVDVISPRQQSTIPIALSPASPRCYLFDVPGASHGTGVFIPRKRSSDQLRRNGSYPAIEKKEEHKDPLPSFA